MWSTSNFGRSVKCLGFFKGPLSVKEHHHAYIVLLLADFVSRCFLFYEHRKLSLGNTYELYECAKALADIVIPQVLVMLYVQAV